MSALRKRSAPEPAGSAAGHAGTARGLALEVLDMVLGDERRPLEAAFDGHPGLGRLSRRDRAFARLLVTTALRHKGTIDARLRTLLARWPGGTLVPNLLRLGAAQLLHLETPPHAAVAETVGLARERAPHAAGMVNAVLRRLPATQPAAWQASTPAWLLESWRKHYGEVTARRIVAAHGREPPLDLTVKSDAAAWAGRLGAALLPNGSLRLVHAAHVPEVAGYDEGAWWVQDVAAALPVQLMGAVRGRRVLDLCAAPGGKTAQLVAAGADVTALDMSPSRMEMLAGNLARLGFQATLVTADAHQWQPPAAFDAVLVDAPCSATGTIRRHPDILWHKNSSDLARHAHEQGRLLETGLRHLRPGGVLVYAVCSLQPEEGEAVIAALLEHRQDALRLPLHRDELMGLPLSPTGEGDLRTLPCDMEERGGMDGFFISRLRKADTSS